MLALETLQCLPIVGVRLKLSLRLHFDIYTLLAFTFHMFCIDVITYLCRNPYADLAMFS